MKPYHPFKFDPNAKLWTPPEPTEPGFTQMDSGLWVPEQYATPEWTKLATTYTFTDPASSSVLSPVTEESFKKAYDKVQAILKKKGLAIMEEFGTTPHQQTNDIFPPNPLSPITKLPADDPYLTTTTELKPPKHPWPLDIHAFKFASMPALLFSTPALGNWEADEEESERANTEAALAEFIPDTNSRQQISALLYVGTQVCCLNLHRINQLWQSRRK